MIVVIPIGGIGERFKNNNYTVPKALINVCGKEIISYLLDNLNITNIEYIFIPYNKEYKKYNFEEFLKQKYPNILFKFYCLENNTRGAAETINIGLNNLDESRDIPVICLDSDNFYLCDIISKWNGENCVFTFKDYNIKPIYSYVECNDNGLIINIKEKEQISNYACTGAYGFKSILDLHKYTSYIIENNITQKNEFYTSGVIKELLNIKTFKNIEILNKDFFSLGTPEQLEEYSHPFIFDLDGTIVNTDHIYTNVWNDIMKRYNLIVDNNFFNFFIQGKNDILFLKNFFPSINNNEIKEISNIKDELFINYLNDYDKDIMIDGAKQFIQKNKNRRMCIVTSCNRTAAEFILKKINLYEYIQFLIASEDCVNNKPNKEPYVKAINILKCNTNFTIFEDSNSGYKSAKQINEAKICLIINDNSSEYILKSNEYKIKSFHDFDINLLHTNELIDIKNIIIKKMDSIPITNIILNQDNIKTGYICDIKSLSLILNNSIEKIIFKVENSDNELSNVARKIHLYSNEVYFYEKISNIINIDVPRFYCSIIIDNKNAILLEDLNKYNGNFNLNLNENIDILLSIVKKISEMHNRFYFQNKKNVIPIMKDLFIINEIKYYNELINMRFNTFKEINYILLTDKCKKILNNIYNNYNKIINISGTYPLNFCHGDLKSPNIFYKEISPSIINPILLDWQYIHLNKGISDIVFLLVESIDYDESIIDIIIKYYYKKSIMYNNFEDLLFDFKISLCIFPFFVMIWFNSENRDNILDKVFPIKFMKNTLNYYDKYLDDDFFNKVNNI